jgi:hypothetical protein
MTPKVVKNHGLLRAMIGSLHNMLVTAVRNGMAVTNSPDHVDAHVAEWVLFRPVPVAEAPERVEMVSDLRSVCRVFFGELTEN